MTLGIISIAVAVLSMAASLRADFGLWRQWCAQLSIIAQHRSERIELPSMHYSSLTNILGARVANVYLDRQHVAGIASDPNDFYTRAFAHYYNLDEVVLIDEQCRSE